MKRETFTNKHGIEFKGYAVPGGLIVSKWGNWGWVIDTVTGESLLPSGISLPYQIRHYFPTRASAIDLCKTLAEMAPWDKITMENIRQYVDEACWQEIRVAAGTALQEAWKDRT